MARSKSKREKVGWVALHPSYGSLRPAMPVASGVFGLSVMQILGWVAVGGINGIGWVAMRIKPGITPFSDRLHEKGSEVMPAPKGKKKFLLWAYPSTLELVKNNYRKDKSKSQSEFIDRAIRYYAGHVTADEDTSYLPNALLSNMKSIVAESDNRQSKMLFKLAVELAMLMNVVAASSEIDEISLARLRGECVQEVKRLNGNFSFEDAVEWQS
ncbi:hypothetical protein [Acutalibacter muris]|nr:hypothetical protein [Acutalibacter muris]